MITKIRCKEENFSLNRERAPPPPCELKGWKLGCIGVDMGTKRLRPEIAETSSLCSISFILKEKIEVEGFLSWI